MISLQIKPWVTFGFPCLLIELFYIGMPVVRKDGRTVTWLPNFLVWVDYHISLAMGLRPRALFTWAGWSSANIQQCSIYIIIIRCKCFFLFIGREPTTWPANNCLQIMVCSCAMPSNCVWLQIIFCTCVKETVLFSFLQSLLRENGRSLRFPRIFIKKTNSVIKW